VGHGLSRGEREVVSGVQTLPAPRVELSPGRRQARKTRTARPLHLTIALELTARLLAFPGPSDTLTPWPLDRQLPGPQLNLIVGREEIYGPATYNLRGVVC
jgi:hypothetical protein